MEMNLDQSGMRDLPMRPGIIPPSAILIIFPWASGDHCPMKVCQARPQDCMDLRTFMEKAVTLWYAPKEARRYAVAASRRVDVPVRAATSREAIT